MSTASDPFAVSLYDPANLPAIGAVAAPTDEMMLHLLMDEEGAFDRPIDAYDYLATNVLAAYEPTAWGILDPERLFPEGITVVTGGWEELERGSIPVKATDAQKQERRARLSATIRLKAQKSEEWPRAHVRRALAHALDLGSKLRRRNEASKIAALEGRHLASGKLPEAALLATAAEVGCSPGKVRSLRASPEYIARRDLAQRCAAHGGGRFIAPVLRHAADDWFVGDSIKEQIASADRVAAHIIGSMREAMRVKSKRGKRPVLPPVHLRRDAFVMVEGFAKRRIPLTPVACAMVDQALGLFDSDGVPVAAPFVGIRKRDTFLAATAYEGTEDGADIVSAYDLRSELQNHGLPTTSPKQLKKWRGRETYQSLVTESRTAEERR